ncbi:MAG: hypothetical protein R2751_08415 [Bacteroidales bacterium]
MSPAVVFLVLVLYFGVLFFISRLTSRNATVDTFFTGNRQSPWYVVAFGMIGASLSGITFVSVPGEVGNSHLYYFQLVLGYLVGYALIALVLLPLYYRLRLVSIYGYLGSRFGGITHRTGSLLFLVSQSIGASCACLRGGRGVACRLVPRKSNPVYVHCGGNHRPHLGLHQQSRDPDHRVDGHLPDGHDASFRSGEHCGCGFTWISQERSWCKP